MKTQKVSVIIPTYKRRESLERAVKSALAQTYENVEVVVVDDNPPDSAYRRGVVELMSSRFRDPRVKYLQNERNSGGAVARNVGVRASTGTIIAFLDDDDWYVPEKIAQQTAYLLKNDGYAGIYCGSYVNGRAVCPNLEGDLSRQILLMEADIYTPTLLMRRDVFDRLKGFSETFRRHQDYEFLLRLFKIGRIGVVPYPLVHLGANDGGNMLHGKQLEELKGHFLSTFRDNIDELESIAPGIRRKIYSRHYAAVCINHFNHGHSGLGTALLIRHAETYRFTFIFELFRYGSIGLRSKLLRLAYRITGR